jgi:hypothetical protein
LVSVIHRISRVLIFIREIYKLLLSFTMSMMLKTSFENDLRLFEMETYSFDELKAKVSQAYDLPKDSYYLKFMDSDGDLITLSCDLDLEMAKKLTQTILKVMVFSIPVASPSSSFFSSSVVLSSSSSSSSSSSDEESNEEDEDEEDIYVRHKEEGKTLAKKTPASSNSPLFQLAAYRLTNFHDAPISAEQLGFICSALSIRPFRLVKFGLVTKDEFKAPHALNDEQKEENSSHSRTIMPIALPTSPEPQMKRGRRGRRAGGERYKAQMQTLSPLFLMGLQRTGTFDVPLPVLTQTLTILYVRPKRFVKKGLLSKGEIRQLKQSARQEKQQEPGFEQGGRWMRRGGRGRGRGRGRGHHPHGHPHHHPHGHHPHGHPHHHPHGHPHHHPHHPHYQEEQGHSHFGGRRGKALCRFVRHETFPDQATVRVNQPFTKEWVVRNDGDHPWPSSSSSFNGTTTLLVSNGRSCGDFHFMEPQEIEGGCEVGEERIVSCHLTAPSLPGLYEAMFRLKDQSSDKKFGQSLWVKVMVVDSSSDDRSTQDDFVKI